jgi:hypothetical protein
MKWSLIILLWINLIYINGYSQANAWINFEQEYLKFSFSQSGVYRLYHEDLKSLSGDLNNVQVFRHGKEVAVIAYGLQDGSFDSLDYLEFFLKANEGEQDSVVYRPHAARPEVKSNLFSDISCFFVTVGKSPGLRLSSKPFVNSSTLETWHLADDFYSFTEEWSFNNTTGLTPYLMQSYFERGENWTGKLIYKDSLAQYRVSLKNYLSDINVPVNFSALVNTRSHVDQNVTFYIGNRPFGRIETVGFNHYLTSTLINKDEISPEDSFIFSSKSSLSSSYQAHSWSNFRVSYPQKIDFKGLDFFTIHLPQFELNTSNIVVENAPNGILAYGLLDSGILVKLSVNSIENRKAVISVPDRKLTDKIFLKYDQASNFIIITHSGLLPSAELYKDYRESSHGGNYKVLVAEMQQLYDQFNYGERSPIAIRNFLDYQYGFENNGDRYLLLLGRGVSFPEVIKNEIANDLVPTVGYPGSDALHSAGLRGKNSNVPLYLTGRIDAKTNDQVINYLNKVKEFEKSESAIWRKNVLHLNGGQNVTEINSFKRSLELLGEEAKNSHVNAEVSHIFKTSHESIENVNISKEVNAGLGFVTFVGHAAPTYPDLNIGFVSDPKLGFNNKGKYPLMFFNGCGVGNIFNRYETLSSDWLLTPDKGSIAILANSFWSYMRTSERYLKILYKNIFNTSGNLGLSIGKIQSNTAEEIANQEYILLEVDNIPFDEANLHQMILQGDPSLVIFPFSEPDYSVDESSIQLQNTDALKSLEGAKEILLNFSIFNLGRIDSSVSIPIKAEIIFDNGVLEKSIVGSVTSTKHNAFSLRMEKPDTISKIKISIDPEGKIIELSKTNNYGEIVVKWDEAKTLYQYPLMVEKDKTNPILLVRLNDEYVDSQWKTFVTPPKISFSLIDENPLDEIYSSITAALKSPGDTKFNPISVASLNLSLSAANVLTGDYQSPSDIGKYMFMINGTDRNGNSSGQNIYIEWEVVDEFSEISVVPSPNPSTENVIFVFRSVPSDSEARIQIFNIAGNIVYDEKLHLKEGNSSIYLIKSLGKGAYAYRISLNGLEFLGKLIVY